MSHYPTSRARHYLQTRINPKWIDIHFIPELIQHIGHRPRDIYMANTQRCGSFCIRNESNANSLCASFNAKKYNCRGRKPTAKKVRISAGIFEIQLTNVNQAMSLPQFAQWVKQLSNATSYAFDIKLGAVEISEGTNECIIAFDTINSAIAVKKGVQKKKFRGLALYFSHWHVPRRTAYPKMREKSESTDGDSSVFSVSSAPAHTQENQMDAVHSLSVRVQKQHALILELSQQNQILANELKKQKKFGKDMDAKYALLYAQYMKKLNMNTMLLWTAEEVTQWIVNLENGRFAKYKDALLCTLSMENVNGSMLARLDAADLYRLGVEDVTDQNVILNHIRDLMRTNDQ